MAKTYYFSVKKHAHDIEFYRNRLKNIMYAMESGEIPMDGERYDRIYDMYHGELEDLHNAILFGSRDGITAQLTGKQIALAKKIVFWASEERAAHCKPEYRQYC